MGSIFGSIRFLLPVCRLCWFLYTLNIYAKFSSHFSQQLLMAEIWYLVTSFIYPISWEAFLKPSDSYFLFGDLVGFYTHWTYMHIFCHIFLSNYWWQKSDIWSQASYRYPYRGKHFWTHRIPTSCLPTLLIFIHIEHICLFFVTFFSATIGGRNLMFGHKLHIGTPYCGKRFLTRQIPTSCLPKSGGIIGEH